MRRTELFAPLRVREFRLLWGSQLLSELGDWSARLALALLVLAESGSVALTALVTAVNLLPWLGPGQLLTARLARRGPVAVLVSSDVMRAAVFGAMALPGVPTGVLLLLAFLSGIATVPFESVRSALLPKTVDRHDYPNALALANVTFQTAITVGYATGGGLVVLLGARGTLLVNAVTFLASALLLSRLRVRGADRVASTDMATIRAGLRAVRSDEVVRRGAILFTVIASCGVVIESLVVVYAVNELGTTSGVAGLIAASMPLGNIAVTLGVRAHGAPRHLLRIASWISVATSTVALAIFLVAPSLPVIVLGFIAAGAMFATGVPVNTIIGLNIDDEARAAAYGVLMGVLQAGSAVGAGLGAAIAAGVSIRAACIVACAGAMAMGFYAVGGPQPRGRHAAAQRRFS